MTHKEKLQQFRVQIRNKEIHQILARKRLWMDYETEANSIIPEPQPIDLPLLKHIAYIAQHQHHLEELHRVGWPKQLKKYLHPSFNYSEQQMLATSALSNILFVSECQQPSIEFTQNILQLLQGKTSTKTMIKTLHLLFNLAYDYKNWVDKLVRNQNLMQRLSIIFNFQNINHQLLSELLLTICKIIERAHFSEQFLKVTQPILELIHNNVAVDPLLITPTLHCLCELSKRFGKQLGLKIGESRFFKKIGSIIKVLPDPKIIKYYAMLALNTLESLNQQTVQQLIFPVLCEKIQTAPWISKVKIYRLFYESLQQNKLSLSLFSKHPIFPKIMGQYELTDDINILEQLSYIFCLCLLNLEYRTQLSLKMIGGLKRGKQLLADKVETQGFIEETLLEYQRLTDI